MCCDLEYNTAGLGKKQIVIAGNTDHEFFYIYGNVDHEFGLQTGSMHCMILSVASARPDHF